MTDDDDEPPYAYENVPKGRHDVYDLREELGVERRLNTPYAVHMAFAIALTNVDAHMEPSEYKQDTLEAIWQAWDHYRRLNDDDVALRYNLSATDVKVVESPTQE
jgi:hypothetical protein